MQNFVLNQGLSRCIRVFFLLALFSILLTSCATPNKQSTILPDPAPSPGGHMLGTTQTDVYVIQAHDELEFVFYGNRDLDVYMDVRPDGFISLPLIGEVRADGRTIPELTEYLEEAYKGELNKPRINIILRSVTSNVVFVGGDVKEGAAIKFDGKITVLQAVSLAGGYNAKTAIITQVLVIRREPGKEPQRYIVDLSKIIDGTDISQDFYLYQYDTIYIPSKE